MDLKGDIASTCDGEQAGWAEKRGERLELLARVDRKRLQRFVYQRVRDFAETEEITQQAYVEAIQSIDRFRAESELSTWLYAIALNLVSNYVRRSPRKRFRFESEEALAEMPHPGSDPLELLSIRLQLAEVMRQIEHLPAEMRETVELVLLDDTSYAEAAIQQAVPVGTIRSRVSRARTLIRQGLLVPRPRNAANRR